MSFEFLTFPLHANWVDAISCKPKNLHAHDYWKILCTSGYNYKVCCTFRDPINMLNSNILHLLWRHSTFNFIDAARHRYVRSYTVKNNRRQIVSSWDIRHAHNQRNANRIPALKWIFTRELVALSQNSLRSIVVESTSITGSAKFYMNTHLTISIQKNTHLILSNNNNVEGNNT